MDHRPLTRRQAVKVGVGSLAAFGVEGLRSAPEDASAKHVSRPFLTPANKFEDVSRGNPKPFTLRGDALLKARLTPETWRLEITADDAPHEGITQKPQIGNALTLAEGNALDYAALLDLS